MSATSSSEVHPLSSASEAAGISGGGGDSYLAQLQARVRAVNGGVPLRQHDRRMRSYDNACTGEEIVDWLVQHQEASSRQSALKLGTVCVCVCVCVVCRFATYVPKWDASPSFERSLSNYYEPE
jgi:Domain found in Dishevelled, Egl-10, and Pleckstrin (DEP)